MYIDKELELAAAQAITTDAMSENIIDQGVAGGALGGQEMEVVCRVHTTFDTTEEDGDLTIELRTSAEATVASGHVILAKSDAIAEAALLANTVVWRCKIPAGSLRYLAVYFNVGTHAFTAGKMDVFLVPLSDNA